MVAAFVMIFRRAHIEEGTVKLAREKNEKTFADYFEGVVSKSKIPAKTVHSWLAGEFMHYTNDAGRCFACA